MLYEFVNSAITFQFLLQSIRIIKFLKSYSRYYSGVILLFQRSKHSLLWTAYFSSSMVLSFTLYNITNWEENNWISIFKLEQKKKFPWEMT